MCTVSVSPDVALATRCRGLIVGLLVGALNGPDFPVMRCLSRQPPAGRGVFWRGGDVRLLGRIPLDRELATSREAPVQPEAFDRIAAQLLDVLEHPAAA